jgi:mannose-6-phosphate isomerase-like protein (cupin superfamily)
MHETITNPVIKDEVTFIQTSAATKGRITTLQVKLMPGGGTPMHYHKNFSETFIVIEGILTITLKDKAVALSPGDKMKVEKEQWHRFSNESAMPVVFTTVVTPGSEGFENALRILYGLAGDQKTNKKGMPNDPLILASISKISDMWPAGPRILIVPLLELMNFIAVLTGVKRKLLKKYCSQ